MAYFRKIAIVAAVLLCALVITILFVFNGAQERAEEKLMVENPLFHTITEGGNCVEGRGDCIGGLTCTNGTCAQP
jgi:hypothetical protein